MEDSTRKKILKRIEKIEAFAQAALDEATALRSELEGSGVPNSSSPQRGKNKKAALAVLKNRRSKINSKQ